MPGASAGPDGGFVSFLWVVVPPRHVPVPTPPDFLELSRRRDLRRLRSGVPGPPTVAGRKLAGGAEGGRDRDDEARFRLAVEAADFGVFEWEVLRDVEYWSDRLKAMFGLPPEAGMDEMRFWPMVHPEDRVPLRAALDGAISPEGDGRLYCRYRILRPDGEVRWIEVHGRARFRDVGGSTWPMRLFGVARDVTGEHAAEEEIRSAKEAAERANLAKSRFLAVASHDLRQPVQNLTLLAHAIAGHVDPDGRPMLARLQASVETLGELLNALLDISRLDAGAMAADIVDFPLSRLLAGLEEYARAAEGKGLAFHVAGSGATVRSDPLLLGRILRNLVENAIKFTDRGGVDIACREAGGEVEISIADTGIGIPPEHRDAVFGEFYQVARPSPGDRGLGLGLAIVRQLVDLLGHGIRMESQPGRGTTFTVTVPLRLAGSPQVARESGGLGTGRPPPAGG